MPINLITRNDFTPKPATEAAKAFAKKTTLSSEAFAKLSAENKARAFRIAGVHKARLVQRARDIVHRAIREGTDYGKVRRQLLNLFDTEGIPAPALSRLRIMFRQNSLQAYSVARTRTLKDPDIAKAFPYWQYLTVGNGTPGINGVRATHAALHGQVFRADNAFWDHYDPPWEWGCRCFKRALTPGQVKALKVPVRDLEFVRKRIAVTGQKKRGITPNPAFDFARDGFDASQFDLSKLDEELRKAVEETL